MNQKNRAKLRQLTRLLTYQFNISNTALISAKGRFFGTTNALQCIAFMVRLAHKKLGTYVHNMVWTIML